MAVHVDTAEERGVTRAGLLRGGLAAGMGLGVIGGLAACGSEKNTGAQTTGSGGSGGGTAGRKVTFVVHDSVPAFAPLKYGFNRFAKEAGWDAEFIGPPKQDIPAIVDLQANAIAAKPDGMILTRIDDKSFDTNIERALEAGIKVVLTNVASDGYKRFGVAFVGQQFIPAGIVAGEQAAKYAQSVTKKTSGTIVLGNAVPGNSAIEQRIEGMRRGIDKHNREKGTSFTPSVLVTSTDESEAVGRVDAKYRKDKGSIVCFATSEGTASFIGTWAKNENLKGAFAIGAFDLTTDVLSQIKSGFIQYSIGQNLYAQGWVAASLLDMELTPGYPATGYDTGAEVVDSSNIDQVTKRESIFS